MWRIGTVRVEVDLPPGPGLKATQEEQRGARPRATPVRLSACARALAQILGQAVSTGADLYDERRVSAVPRVRTGRGDNKLVLPHERDLQARMSRMFVTCSSSTSRGNPPRAAQHRASKGLR
jgi:hypothetical protein